MRAQAFERAGYVVCDACPIKAKCVDLAMELNGLRREARCHHYRFRWTDYRGRLIVECDGERVPRS
jgi:hypothetical protein